MDSFAVSAGGSLTIRVTLRDGDGAIADDYDGTQGLATSIWPGGARAAALTPATTWVSPSAGLIAIAIADEDTADLTPGRYQVLTRLDDAGSWVDVFACTLDVTPTAGAEPEPKVYCSYADLLNYAGSWLPQLATVDDETGFVEARARARSKIEDIAHAHYPSAAMPLVSGYGFGYGYGAYSGSPWAVGPYVSGRRSTTLQGYFDADYLIVTDQVRECACKYALSFICERQIGVDDAAAAYGRLAGLYRRQAEALATCLVLGLDTDGDSIPDLTIDCSYISPLRG